MTTKLIAFAVGAAAFLWLHVFWVVAVAIGLATWFIFFRPVKNDDILLQTVNMKTGSVRTHGRDRAAKKYLGTRRDL